MGIVANWQSDGMSFAVDTDSHHTVIIDAASKVGGRNLGPRPTEMLLTALATCSGIDVVSILQKSRAGLSGMQISVDGDRFDGYPQRFTTIRVQYDLTGTDLTDVKAERAILLSRDKYCSVAATLNSNLEYRYRINGGEWVDLSNKKLEVSPATPQG